MKKVGYLGPRGTFTEAAARKYRGNDRVELVCRHSLPEIVAAVKSGQLDEAVVPLENSTEGAVNQVLDLVAQVPGIMFCGEVIMNIHHNLLVRPGTEKSRISRVLSHPQALAQCREYLARELPGRETEETASTARAAAIVAASREPWAAIGTRLAAGNYGLEVLAEGIQDCAENATRFIVLGRNDADCSPRCRTSLIVAVKDRPGALYVVLREFALRDINLTRIESRPVKKRLGQYLFFMDLEGHRSEAAVSGAIEAIAGKAAWLKILGSYPRDNAAACQEPAGAGEKNNTIGELRAEIDMVDRQIVELIGMRTRLVGKIGQLKSGPAGVRDRAREEEVVRRVRAHAAAKGADPDMIEGIYRYMISHYVEMQEEGFRM
ncbi:MAG: prephenate dehydratase [Bacillota bacterium]